MTILGALANEPTGERVAAAILLARASSVDGMNAPLPCSTSITRACRPAARCFERTEAAMFVAGDDPDAKRVEMELAGELGFVPEDAGGLANAKALEHMVRVWLALAQAHGRGIAFAISRR